MNLAKVILVVDIAISFLSFSFDTPCISVYNLGNNDDKDMNAFYSKVERVWLVKTLCEGMYLLPLNCP